MTSMTPQDGGNDRAASEQALPAAPRGKARIVISRLVRVALILAVLALSIWYVARNIDWDGLGRAILEMHIGWVIAGACITLLAHLARAQRWRILIPDGDSIPLLHTFSATIIGYLMNNLIPRSGELVRPYVLAKREDRPMSGLVATVLVERVLDGLSLVAIFVVLLVLERNRLNAVFTGYSAGSILLSIALPVVAIVILMVLMVKTPLGERATALVERMLPARFRGRIRRLLDDFRTGITLGGAAGTLKILGWTIVIWLGYAGALYAGIVAFNFDTVYGMGFSDALTVLAITAVGVTIAPTPGAFGVYHSFCKIALTSLYSIPPERAVACAVVTHAGPYLAVTVVGLIFLLRENISVTKIIKQETAGEG